MPITTLPALSRTAITFKADVDTFFGTQLPAFATEANALQTDVNAKQTTASSAATTATTKANEAATSASNALASQNSASTSAATATTKAGEASTSATSASGSAATATTKANEAAASAASVVRDGSGGVAGLTLFKLNLINALGTVTSWFTTAATAARTWTLPDKDGTVAMTSDFAAPGPIGGTTPAAGAFTTLSSTGSLGATIGDGVCTLELLGRSDLGYAIVGTDTNHPVSLRVNNLEVARLLSTGLAVSGVLSANGISFPATQVASSDANTLDDYEEGTFTPTIIGVSSAGTGTYSVQVGRYTKIGNRVNFTVFLVWSAHTGSGDMRVSGLPFTSATATNSNYAVTTRPSDIALAVGHYPMGYVLPSTTQVIIQQGPTGGGPTIPTPIDTSGNLMISGHYEV